MSGAKSEVTRVSELALAPKLYRLKKSIWLIALVLLLLLFHTAYP